MSIEISVIIFIIEVIRTFNSITDPRILLAIIDALTRSRISAEDQVSIERELEDYSNLRDMSVINFNRNRYVDDETYTPTFPRVRSNRSENIETARQVGITHDPERDVIQVQSPWRPETTPLASLRSRIRAIEEFNNPENYRNYIERGLESSNRIDEQVAEVESRITVLQNLLDRINDMLDD